MSAPPSPPERGRVKVWDALVRGLHWGLVIVVVTAWLTGHWPKKIHDPLGYIAGAIVLARILWGFVGSPYARFKQFIVSPRATWRYTRELLARREPHHLGHNPLGAWMIVALLACVAALSITGILYTTDWLFGYAWLEALHAGLAWALAGLVVAHVAGVIFTSLRQKENLVAAMLTGYKDAPPADVSHSDAPPHP